MEVPVPLDWASAAPVPHPHARIIPVHSKVKQRRVSILFIAHLSRRRLHEPSAISLSYLLPVPCGRGCPSPEGDDGILWELFREKTGILGVDQEGGSGGSVEKEHH